MMNIGKHTIASSKAGERGAVVMLAIAISCLQGLALPIASDGDKQKLEKEFGKYFGSYKNFDIYGVRKKAGNRDGERDSQGIELSTLTGIIISPSGRYYDSRKFSAEVKTDKGAVIKCVTSDKRRTYSFSLQKGFQKETETSKSTGRQITPFEWFVPSSTEPSTLRITGVDLK